MKSDAGIYPRARGVVGGDIFFRSAAIHRREERVHVHNQGSDGVSRQLNREKCERDEERETLPPHRQFGDGRRFRAFRVFRTFAILR